MVQAALLLSQLIDCRLLLLLKNCFRLVVPGLTLLSHFTINKVFFRNKNSELTSKPGINNRIWTLQNEGAHVWMQPKIDQTGMEHFYSCVISVSFKSTDVMEVIPAAFCPQDGISPP